MAKLSPELKLYIVQRLAVFDLPATIIKAVKDEYGIVVTSQQLQAYDPNTVNGAELSKKLKDVFYETRKKYLEDTSSIPITHKAHRLAVLNRLINQAESRGNAALAAHLLEQAAKEMGGAFTNRREISGPDGKPIEAKVATETLDPKQLSTAAIKELLAARICEPAPADH